MDFVDLPALLQARLPPLAAVYLFGSHAQGGARAESDVDLAALPAGGPIDRLALFDAQEAAAAALNRDVDLVDLRVASTVLAFEVVSQGRLILDLDPLKTGLFEVFTQREYADLMERLMPIHADIRARGRVYGNQP